MKKLIAVVLAVVLSVAMIVPANAAGETYMIFACETDDGCGIHPGFGTLWGPVGQSDDLGHPYPVQGNNSYCVNTSTAQTVVFHNMTHNTGVTTTGTFNASNYDYIELDIYSSQDILCDWNFGVCTDVSDPTGASWKMQSAWIPAGRWYHVRMPISEFGGFEGGKAGSMSNINRIKMMLTSIIDTDQMMNFAQAVTPLYTYIYFDNVVATKGGAGRESELINFDTLLTNPPEWYEQYLKDRESFVDPPPPPEVNYGDIDGNDIIDASDALLVLQDYVGKITLSDAQKKAADCSGEGIVDAADALLILQHYVSKITEFPAEVTVVESSV